jgi:uncharacterized membrane protein
MTLSWTHVHLLLNHFPIVGKIFALLIFIIGMARKNRPLKQASYWIFFLMALLAIPVYYSGTQAYATVESLPNVREALIHRHREVAEWSFMGLEIMGALGLMGILIARRDRLAPGWFNAVFLLIALASTALVSWAGIHGGTIRHTEVRNELSAILLNPENFAHEEGESHGHAEEGEGHGNSEEGRRAQPANPADEAQPTNPPEDSSDHGESPSHPHE